MFLHQDFSNQTTAHLNTYILMLRFCRTLVQNSKENRLNINNIPLRYSNSDP